MKKVLFFDIDGTLLNSKIDLEDDLIDFFKNFNKKDVILCISTGRSYVNAIKYANDLGINNLVLSNGLNVFKDGKEIYSKTLDEDLLDLCINNITCHSDYIGYCTKNDVYILDSDNVDKVHSLFTGYGHMSVNIVNELPTDKIQKLSVSTANKQELDTIIENLPKEFCAYRWTDRQCEIQPFGLNKATGMKEFLKQLDGEFETYAFGDGVNDIEMMEFVDHPIVMGNAYEELKKYAEVILDTIDNNGLLKYLQKEYGETND